MKDERTTARWRIRGWKLYRSLNRGNVARAACIQANKRRHTGAQEKARKLAHERAQVLSSCTLHPVSAAGRHAERKHSRQRALILASCLLHLISAAARPIGSSSGTCARPCACPYVFSSVAVSERDVLHSKTPGASRAAPQSH